MEPHSATIPTTGSSTLLEEEEELGFEPTEHIPWRKDMSISMMLDDIVQFQDEYRRRLKSSKSMTELDEDIKKKLLVKYMHGIMVGEGIGVQSKGETLEIMNAVDQEDDSEGSVEHNVSRSLDTPSLDMEPFAECSNNSTDPSYNAKRLETKNLYRAYNHIKDVTKEWRDQNTSLNEQHVDDYHTKNDIGFLEIETFILSTHKILLNGIQDTKKGTTRPGTFSNKPRKTDDHEYPHFVQEAFAEAAVQRLVDRHNDLLNKMSDIGDRKQQVKYIFKCTSLFLNGFLALHPFGDGNGRLARLLCGYMLLRSLFPFTLPIYNVYSESTRDDYLKGLIEAQQGNQLPTAIKDKDTARQAANMVYEQKPKLLCSMIIESNWCVWKKYHKLLNDTMPKEINEAAK